MLEKIKEYQRYIAIAVFCILALAGILVGILALHYNIVAVCALVVLEVGIAMLLSKVPLWVHGVILLCEIIVSILTSSIIMVLICVVLYIAALVALKFIIPGEK